MKKLIALCLIILAATVTTACSDRTTARNVAEALAMKKEPGSTVLAAQEDRTEGWFTATNVWTITLCSPTDTVESYIVFPGKDPVVQKDSWRGAAVCGGQAKLMTSYTSALQGSPTEKERAEMAMNEFMRAISFSFK